ncbi:MAG: cysteine dioxygenase, partial [Chthoniobacterales bacterium]
MRSATATPPTRASTIATTASSCHTPALSRLIAAIRAVVQTESDAARAGLAVAELLRPCLGADDFLRCDQFEPDPTCYRQHVLHTEPDGSFSVVALVWLPGQT